PGNGGIALNELLADRRGPIGAMEASRANLEIPLPLIDLVNESLEWLADGVGVNTSGIVANTNPDILGGHPLRGGNADLALMDLGNPVLHDPATLYEALPEYSTPATPTFSQGAYDALQADFTAPELPYAQALDVNRTYLGH